VNQTSKEKKGWLLSRAFYIKDYRGESSFWKIESKVVKGWNCGHRSLPSSRGKTRGQGWHLITPQKELPSLAYSTTSTQVIIKKSHKEK